MSAPHFERRTVSFIVRLWTESSEIQKTSDWRGQIEHVGSGELAYFQGADRLVETVIQLVPELAPLEDLTLNRRESCTKS
ncbi:hypothetical protein HYR54_02195 [Candidatus Acetothermia bacterium]|nr:hypothetical protein [Candidatus Acetothermia bacterium]MBI3460957.1 hypothetical protein [Candidatus Acetothermia bacterium]MBI3660625.1 hypothetical protein [Candidatus Acetothermia bacterium]